MIFLHDLDGTDLNTGHLDKAFIKIDLTKENAMDEATYLLKMKPTFNYSGQTVEYHTGLVDPHDSDFILSMGYSDLMILDLTSQQTVQVRAPGSFLSHLDEFN